MLTKDMVINKTAILCFLLAFSGGSNADIYKWVDDNGNLHFSDKVPKGTHFERMKEKHAPVVSNPRQTKPSKPTAIKPAASDKASPPPLSQAPPPFSDALCAALLVELDTAKRQEAVFRDNKGLLHTHKSRFSNTYQGKRHYLDAPERRQILAGLEAKNMSQCNSDEASLRRYSLALTELNKQKECEHLQLQLNELKPKRRRTAESQIRGMQRFIDKNCS